jgi:CheY-like chemotaxis protein
MLGGDIRVDSEEGKGSKFSISLTTRYMPVQEAAPKELPKTGGPNSGDVDHPAESRRIIVSIDDDPNVISLITQELEEEGYRVEGATRALEGIEKARLIGPDAITLDIMMPGMDGWETITRLKADPQTRDIPLIVLSIIDNKELGFRLGADEYLVKPVDKDALVNVLQKFEGRGKEVLVADDDPVVIDLARQLLEEDGWTVRSAGNGKEALEELARRRPDVLLLDLMMPVMDGFETLHQIRENPDTKDLPVIIVTAKDLSPQEREELALNTSRIIQKDGLDRDRILRELRESLRSMVKRAGVA